MSRLNELEPLDPLTLCEFLDHGYLELSLPDIPPEDERHDQIFEKCTRLCLAHSKTRESGYGLDLIADNIHLHIPELHDVLESPHLDRALTGILGPQYLRYNHSFIHAGSTTEQGFHKDSPLPWGSRGGIRSHSPQSAMVFYYPQKTAIDRGATEILGGSQYWTVNREEHNAPEGEDRLDWAARHTKSHALESYDEALERHKQVQLLEPTLRPLPLVVEKGAVVVVDFNLFHRATRLRSTLDRYMLKFWYFRMTYPRSQCRVTVNYRCADHRRQHILAGNARKLGLKVDFPQSKKRDANHSITGEADRIHRAYERAQANDVTLFDELCSENESARRAAVYGLSSLDSVAVEVLVETLEHPTPSVRAGAAFLCGEVGRLDPKVSTNLTRVIKSDDDADVRYNAIAAFGKVAARSLCERSGKRPEIGDCIDTLLWVVELLQLDSGSRRRASVERQLAYLGLLSIVSSISQPEVHRTELERVAERAGKAVFQERDRYAKGTAIELLTRLAAWDLSTATSACLVLLRNERWQAATHR